MQYFSETGQIQIGKHKGKLFVDLPRQYVKWAKKNLPQFKEQLKAISNGKRITHLDALMPLKSSCGNGTISNKGFRPPNPKRFQSKAKRIAGATLNRSTGRNPLS
jgi:uncharacterized protein (DUF3820 family)